VWGIAGMILTDGKTKVLGKNPVPVSLFHHKYHTDWPQITPEFPGERPATGRLRLGRAN